MKYLLYVITILLSFQNLFNQPKLLWEQYFTPNLLRYPSPVKIFNFNDTMIFSYKGINGTNYNNGIICLNKDREIKQQYEMYNNTNFVLTDIKKLNDEYNLLFQVFSNYRLYIQTIYKLDKTFYKFDAVSDSKNQLNSDIKLVNYSDSISYCEYNRLLDSNYIIEFDEDFNKLNKCNLQYNNEQYLLDSHSLGKSIKLQDGTYFSYFINAYNNSSIFIKNNTVGQLSWSKQIHNKEFDKSAIISILENVKNELIVCGLKFKDGKKNIFFQKYSSLGDEISEEISEFDNDESILKVSLLAYSNQFALSGYKGDFINDRENLKFLLILFDDTGKMLEKYIWKKSKSSWLADVSEYSNGNLAIFGFTGEDSLLISEIQPKYLTDKFEEIQPTSVRVFPNPVENIINISCPDQLKYFVKDISIFDINGNLKKFYLMFGQDKTISILDLSNGTYYLRMSCNNLNNANRTIFTQKIVINK